MSDPNTGTLHHRTISQYRLTRLHSVVLSEDTDFMWPYLNPTDDIDYYDVWVSYIIMNGRTMINGYAVSPSLNAYITYSVELTKDERVNGERLVDMRYRDMMVDNYLHAGGQLDTWRWVGTHCIVHLSTRELIGRCFVRAGKNFAQPGTVEILASTLGFDEVTLRNPFTRGIRRMLRRYRRAMANAKIKRIIFISQGAGHDPTISYLNPKFHLVVEFCRPGEDGYPAGGDF